MKVTSLIPDDLINEVRQYAGKNNLTECLITALSEWVSQQKIKELNIQLHDAPLSFSDNFSAESIRKLNRKT
jgi:hypothetical protein